MGVAFIEAAIAIQIGPLRREIPKARIATSSGCALPTWTSEKNIGSRSRASASAATVRRRTSAARTASEDPASTAPHNSSAA